MLNTLKNKSKEDAETALEMAAQSLLPRAFGDSSDMGPYETIVRELLSEVRQHVGIDPSDESDAGRTRVLNELSTEISDLELTGIKPWNVPYARNAFFTGRDDVLNQLRQNLQSGKPAALTQALAGLGGIGKTQTAVEYAYRHRDDYSAVLWLNAASTEALMSGFADVARLLGLPEASAQDQAVTTAAVRQWLQDNTGWLLILDNADDIALGRQALPTVPRGHVLITTRAHALGGIAEPVRILRLPSIEAAYFLLRRGRILRQDSAFADASESECAAALAIADELGGLPLALDQAGAFLEETPSTPQRYLDLYRARRIELLGQRDVLGEADHASVTTTFSLAFERAEAMSPASGDLLRLAAFLGSDDIPRELLTKGAKYFGGRLGAALRGDQGANSTIAAAHHWSLLDHDLASDTFSLHRLVQLVIRESMDAKQQRIWAERAMLGVYSAFPDPQDISTWPRCVRLAPHAQAVAEWIDRLSINTAEAGLLLDRLAQIYYFQGDYSAAEPRYLRALEVNTGTVGPEHPDTAISLNNLAGLYEAKGKYSDAEQLYKHAIAILEKALGPGHLSAARVRANYAGLRSKIEPRPSEMPLVSATGQWYTGSL
jgi:tetratricopeptide (TPR) repeat protein